MPIQARHILSDADAGLLLRAVSAGGTRMRTLACPYEGSRKPTRSGALPLLNPSTVPRCAASCLNHSFASRAELLQSLNPAASAVRAQALLRASLASCCQPTFALLSLASCGCRSCCTDRVKNRRTWRQAEYPHGLGCQSSFNLLIYALERRRVGFFKWSAESAYRAQFETYTLAVPGATYAAVQGPGQLLESAALEVCLIARSNATLTC